MPIDYDYLFKLKNHYNNDIAESKDDIIADLQTTMQKEIDNYIETYEVKVGMPEYNETVTKNFTIPIQNCVVVQERYKEKIYNLNSKTLWSPKNAFETGDYVTRNEAGVDETYIVRARIDRKRTYDSSFLLHCPYSIKILDDDGVTIHTLPVSFQDNKSRPGVSERSETGVTENSTFQAYVRHDNVSRRFIDVTGTTASGKSNKITRVIIDGLAYEIKGSDPVSMKGLITLGLELTNKTSDDNLELGIADYYNNLPQPEEPPADLVINCEWNDIEIGGTNTYTIDTNNTVTWGLTNNGNGVTLGLTGVNGQCTVTCDEKTYLIGRVETLTAYLDYGAEVTKEIPIVGLI